LGERNSCVTECGHAFCLSCLLQAVQRKPDCPLCRQVLVSPELSSMSDDLFAYWSTNNNNNNNNTDYNNINMIPVMDNNNHSLFGFSFDDLFPIQNNNIDNNIDNNNNIHTTLENANPYAQTSQQRWHEQMLFASMEPLEPVGNMTIDDEEDMMMDIDDDMPELQSLAESMSENVLSEQDWINQHPVS
jgi:hypothetical protein